MEKGGEGCWGKKHLAHLIEEMVLLRSMGRISGDAVIVERRTFFAPIQR